MRTAYEYGGITFGIEPIPTRQRVTTWRTSTRQQVVQHHPGFNVRVTYRDPETGKPVIERPGWFFQKSARATEAGKRLARDIARGQGRPS